MISPRHEQHDWTWQEPHCLPRGVEASLWCDCVPWQSEFCDTVVCALEMQFRRERVWAMQSDVTSGIARQSVYTFLIFKRMLGILWRELVFDLKPCRSSLVWFGLLTELLTVVIGWWKDVHVSGCIIWAKVKCSLNPFCFHFLSARLKRKKKGSFFFYSEWWIKKTLPLTSISRQAKAVTPPSEAGAEMSIRISPRGHPVTARGKKVPSFMCQPQRCGRTSLLTSWWSSWTILPGAHRLQFNIH